MEMISSPTTLVVGGTFRRSGDKLLVQKRSWEMIRIFADHMTFPVLAMHETPSDETLAYELPPAVEVVVLPLEGVVARTAKSICNTRMTDVIEDLLGSGAVVYLRMPDWASWRVFNRAVSKGNRVIVSLHGDWADGYRRKKGNPAKRVASFLAARYVDYAYKTISRQSEVLFCTGEKLHEQYGHLARKSVVIANFLHSAEDVRVPDRRVMASPCRILFVGHLEERKGLIYLLKGARLLADWGIDSHVTIIGAGPLRAGLARSADELGISETVDFIDYIQYGKELLEQYRKADIFVLPSISSEGMPKVLMEAMSQGVPVVSTDVGSSKCLLGNGKLGLVVQPKDERELADAIKTLIANEPLRNKFIDKGLELARNSTRDVQARKVEEALRDSVPAIRGVPTYLAQDRSRCRP